MEIPLIFGIWFRQLWFWKEETSQHTVCWSKSVSNFKQLYCIYSPQGRHPCQVPPLVPRPPKNAQPDRVQEPLHTTKITKLQKWCLHLNFWIAGLGAQFGHVTTSTFLNGNNNGLWLKEELAMANQLEKMWGPWLLIITVLVVLGHLNGEPLLLPL